MKKNIVDTSGWEGGKFCPRSSLKRVSELEGGSKNWKYNFKAPIKKRKNILQEVRWWVGSIGKAVLHSFTPTKEVGKNKKIENLSLQRANLQIK